MNGKVFIDGDDLGVVEDNAGDFLCPGRRSDK
jgi:hypothetical protein